ncbi:MAG: DUF2183 domain-containing protein [Chlorobi bacterium]|nr:DUF2183 domain-containing protein [Chlorobiota bacterium]
MPTLWQISVVQFARKTHISGVILDNTLPAGSTERGVMKNITTVIKSYYLKTYHNREIIIKSGDVKIFTQTDDYGGFSVEIDRLETSPIRVFLPDSSEPLKIRQDYPVVFSNAEFPLAIISDIDDTIMISHTANLYKRLGILFFVTPHKRKSIDFTYRLLKTVNDKGGNVFYVSKSESNLFEVLTSFIRKNNLPEGKLFLTPYLSFRKLLRSKKGRDFKEDAMRFIIVNSPGKKFILLGDDTQQDMAVYTRIAQLYPDKIIKVFIRRTRNKLKGKKEDQWNNLNDLPLPTIYFSDEDDVSGEIETIENYR